MEYRHLRRSCLSGSTITFGAMTFVGTGFFAKDGTTRVDEAPPTARCRA
jgi:aryl-alcohol dehydrogenase-like predicted oxidoreductase